MSKNPATFIIVSRTNKSVNVSGNLIVFCCSANGGNCVENRPKLHWQRESRPFVANLFVDRSLYTSTGSFFK